MTILPVELLSIEILPVCKILSTYSDNVKIMYEVIVILAINTTN